MREFQELIKSPGWAQLVDYAEKQMNARRINVEGPSGGLDGCITQEYEKGEIAGIRLFLNIPAVAMEQFTEQLEELKKEMNDG